MGDQSEHTDVVPVVESQPEEGIRRPPSPLQPENAEVTSEASASIEAVSKILPLEHLSLLQIRAIIRATHD